MNSDPATATTSDRVPRFYAVKENGVWTWGYRRPGEKPPAGVRSYVHTRIEAVEIARELNAEEAARRAAPAPEPFQFDLFDGGQR